MAVKMQTSRNNVIPRSHQGSARDQQSSTNAARPSSLSASGSRSAPIRVNCFRARARIPSSASVIIAPTKTASAAFRSPRRKRATNTGTATSLAPVRAFGTFTSPARRASGAGGSCASLRSGVGRGRGGGRLRWRLQIVDDFHWQLIERNLHRQRHPAVRVVVRLHRAGAAQLRLHLAAQRAVVLQQRADGPPALQGGALQRLESVALGDCHGGPLGPEAGDGDGGRVQVGHTLPRRLEHPPLPVDLAARVGARGQRNEEERGDRGQAQHESSFARQACAALRFFCTSASTVWPMRWLKISISPTSVGACCLWPLSRYKRCETRPRCRMGTIIDDSGTFLPSCARNRTLSGVFCSGPRKWLRVLTTSWNALGAESGMATIWAACSSPSPSPSQPSATPPWTCKRSARLALLSEARSTRCAIALRSETPSKSRSASLKSIGASSTFGAGGGGGSSHAAAAGAAAGAGSAESSPRIASSGSVSSMSAAGGAACAASVTGEVPRGGVGALPCTTRL